jgi:hypothetical protein
MELHQKFSCSAISRLKWLRIADMVYKYRDSPMATPVTFKVELPVLDLSCSNDSPDQDFSLPLTAFPFHFQDIT